jgi:hypothetical protein
VGDELQSKLSGASEDKDAGNEIYELGKKRDQWKGQLDGERTEISNRIYNGKNCMAARVDMANIFGETCSNADHETDPAIVIEAIKLLPYWETGQKTHNDELGKTQIAVQNCDNMR